MSDVLREIKIRSLGLMDYVSAWQAMQQFTSTRAADTCDELWCLEHFPVYTQGQAGKAEHVLHAGDIPIVQSDRGGQVTYHGPGQLIIYTLIDLQRRHMGVRELVTILENSIIDTLADFNVQAHNKPEAPGVYVGDAKIASLGLRVRRGRSFHGLSLNVNMDLRPFEGINPCGYAGLAVTHMKAECGEENIRKVQDTGVTYLLQRLGYTELSYATALG